MSAGPVLFLADHLAASGAFAVGGGGIASECLDAPGGQAGQFPRVIGFRAT